MTGIVPLKKTFNNQIWEALMQPTSVGIREAKIHLSKLLKLVQRGNEVILTDCGQASLKRSSIVWI